MLTSPVVAVCQGHRCAALLAGQRPDPMDVLRAAARDSQHGLLMTTACAGLCAQGPVVAVGSGGHAGGVLRVATSVVLGPVDLPAVDDLAQHLRGPSGTALPRRLRRLRLRPAADHLGPLASSDGTDRR
jgi:(2Fe-2S) ferredoxin